MRTFAIFAAICALIIVGGYVAWSVMYPTIVIRYRLSLDVEVDGEKKTSSGVVEVAYNILPNSLSFAGSSGDVFSGRMRGAAITVDLGSHGIAFVANCASLAPQMLRSQSVPLWDLPWVAFKPYAVAMTDISKTNVGGWVQRFANFTASRIISSSRFVLSSFPSLVGSRPNMVAVAVNRSAL
jgi:hypothetical protein